MDSCPANHPREEQPAVSKGRAAWRACCAQVSRARTRRIFAVGALLFSYVCAFYTFKDEQHHFEVMQKGDQLFFLFLTTKTEFKESYLMSYYYGTPFPFIEQYKALNGLRNSHVYNFEQETAKSEVFDGHKKLSAIIRKRGLEDRADWIEKKYRDTEKTADDHPPIPEQTKP